MVENFSDVAQLLLHTSAGVPTYKCTSMKLKQYSHG